MNTIVARVESHLDDVSKDPSTPLSSAILAELDTSLCGNLSSETAISLIARIAALIPILQQNPVALTVLAEGIAESAPITFTQVLDVRPSIPLLEGLSAPFPPINLVTLALLQTTRSDSEIAIVASKPEIVEALINLWLRSEDIGVSSKAWRVIAQLLGAEIDSSSISHMRCYKDINTETNLMWRRLTTDKTVYGLLFSLTSLKTLGQSGQLPRKAKGISQFRLLDLVVTFSQVPDLWRSHIPEIEQQYGVDHQEGLINYALLHMVDSQDDILEQLQLLTYYAEFLTRSPPMVSRIAEYVDKLRFMIDKGIHGQMIQQFLNPDTEDPMGALLSSSIIGYIQGYVSHYPIHFIEDSTHTKEKILQRIDKVLTSTSPNQWARNDEPTGLLRLISSLPRAVLLQPSSKESLINSLPLRPANQNVVSCLAYIFNGQASSTTTKTELSENSSARALFLIYLGAHPTFFDDIVKMASMVAIPGIAAAALAMLEALATASWSDGEIKTNDGSTEDNESNLRSVCSYYGGLPLPKDGISALLLPPAITRVVPILLSSSQHLSGVAYPIAQKKFDVIVAFERQVRAMSVRDGGQDQTLVPLLAALGTRLRNGVLGRGVGVDNTGGSEDVTHTIATLSR